MSRFRTYTAADGLAERLCRRTQRALKTDALWIGTLHGLSRLERRGASKRSRGKIAQPATSSPRFMKIPQASCGSVPKTVASTVLQNGKLVRYPASLGLPSSIYAIVEDGPFLWLTSQNGPLPRRQNRVGKALTMARFPSPNTAQPTACA